MHRQTAKAPSSARMSVKTRGSLFAGFQTPPRGPTKFSICVQSQGAHIVEHKAGSLTVAVPLKSGCAIQIKQQAIAEAGLQLFSRLGGVRIRSSPGKKSAALAVICVPLPKSKIKRQVRWPLRYYTASAGVSQGRLAAARLVDLRGRSAEAFFHFPQKSSGF